MKRSVWDLLDRTGDGCWEWRGRVQNGRVTISRRLGTGPVQKHSLQAVVYHLGVKPLEPGYTAVPRCGNALCGNPCHALPVRDTARAPSELREERRVLAARAYDDFSSTEEQDPEAVRIRYGLSPSQASRLFSGKTYRDITLV